MNKAVEILLEIWNKLEEVKQIKGWYSTSTKKGSFVSFEKFNQESKIKEIIRNNIYGVDLNAESVEITKLSLFLKISNRSNPKLINLNNNIKCGNSLIGGMNEQNWKLFEDDIKEILLEKDESEREFLIQSLNRKCNKSIKEQFGDEFDSIKSFNWEVEFIDIFFCINEKGEVERRGFDVVIGNPPYVDYRKIDDTSKKIFNKSYKLTKYSKNGSLYIYFIEKGMEILNQNRILSFINPYQYLSADSGFGIRKLILDNFQISKIVDVSNIRVFEDASTYTCINNLIKEKPQNNQVEIIRCFQEEDINKKGFFVLQNDFIKNNYLININPNYSLISKINNLNFNVLKYFCDVFCGTSATGFSKKIITENDYNNLDSKNKQHYIPVLQSSNIQKYGVKRFNEFIEKSVYPNEVLLKFNTEKLFLARMTKEIRATYENRNIGGGKVNLILSKTGTDLDLKYILLILNSKCIDFWYHTNFESKHLQGGYLGFDIPSVEQIPIPQISKEEQQPFIEKADIMLQLHKEFYNDINFYIDNLKIDFELEKVPKKVEKFYELTKEEFLKELNKISKSKSKIQPYYNEFEEVKEKINDIKEKINREEEEINAMVYELYNLTDDEIQIIEEDVNN